MCSGIEAASAAWMPLGWQPVAFSEIEPFPCSVLAHHYPDVPNLGDMTTIASRVLVGEVEAPDVLCGGTPCQAFSVAGLRQSLDDARGNLTLKFVEIADAIDHVRAGRGEDECIVFWENVPGVLSTKDNAFGCFLGGLAGEDGPLEPPGGKWANAGAVYGPRRAVAWRTLDAQYFGVAQRRRRVFVVASARKGFDPATVLFEWDGVRRDTAPSREARQTAPTIPARSTGGGGLGTDFDCDGGIVQVCPTLRAGGNRTGGDRPPGTDVDTADSLIPVAYGGNNQSGPIDVATARNACASASGRMDFETETFLVQPTHALRGEGFDASEDGTGRGTPLVPMFLHTNKGRPDGRRSAHTEMVSVKDIVETLTTDGHAQSAVAVPVAYGIRTANTSSNGWGIQEECTHTLDCAQGLAVAVALRGREGGATAELGDEVQNCLRASSGGGDKPHVLCETLYNKGFNHGGLYASTQETHAGKILRTLREAVGEEAFAQWGLGILGSLQSPEILRQALHGLSIRPAAFSRSWVVHCALSRSENGSGWLLQSLREAGCERCASQGWEPSEQLAGELGAYLSELSRPGAQAARFLHDLWQASQGLGVLRQALSAVQEVGRPAGRQGQSILGSPSGRGEEGAENVLSSKVQCEVSRERVLHEARAAGEARYSRNGAVEQERSGKGWVGEAPFAVRRLTVEECEFLQGFPRGYTAIPWRGKPADQCPDGPRYKSLGNSWAVPVAAWVGKRIQELENGRK